MHSRGARWVEVHAVASETFLVVQVVPRDVVAVPAEETFSNPSCFLDPLLSIFFL